MLTSSARQQVGKRRPVRGNRNSIGWPRSSRRSMPPKPGWRRTLRPRRPIQRPHRLRRPSRCSCDRTAACLPRLRHDRTAASPQSKPEVRETRSGLAGWFRSALGDRSPQREPARVPVPGPTAPPRPADSVPRQPEPEVEAPAPVAAQPEETPRPTREPAAALKPTTAEEAADTIRFTFDPIPPVPPRLPREPKEPPKENQ